VRSWLANAAWGLAVGSCLAGLHIYLAHRSLVTAEAESAAVLRAVEQELVPLAAEVETVTRFETEMRRVKYLKTTVDHFGGQTLDVDAVTSLLADLGEGPVDACFVSWEYPRVHLSARARDPLEVVHLAEEWARRQPTQGVEVRRLVKPDRTGDFLVSASWTAWRREVAE